MLLAQLRVRLVAESELRSRAEKRLRHLVEHDELTDLPNRRALLAHMERRIAAGETGARRGAVSSLWIGSGPAAGSPETRPAMSSSRRWRIAFPSLASAPDQHGATRATTLGRTRG